MRTDPTTRVLLRSGDTLIALLVTEAYIETLNRIQLQKVVYLMDAVSHLYAFRPPREAHVIYKRGPYDLCLQNAVDALAFRGLISVTDVDKRRGGAMAVTYALNTTGRACATQLIQEQAFSAKHRVAQNVAENIHRLGWDHLVRLVYAEPTFARTRLGGYGQRLFLNDGAKCSATFLTTTIARAVLDGLDATLDPSLLVRVFFDYLAEYARLSQQSNHDDNVQVWGDE